MNIWFDRITFAYPAKLTDWAPPTGPGIYCICVADQAWRPEPFRPIYFGVAADLAERHLLRDSDWYQAWIAHAGSVAKLLVAHVHLPEFSIELRHLFTQQLAAHYLTPFNELEPLPKFELPKQILAGSFMDPLPTPESSPAKDLVEEPYAQF